MASVGQQYSDMEKKVRKKEAGKEVKSHMVSGEPYQPASVSLTSMSWNLPRLVSLPFVPPLTLTAGPGVQEGWRLASKED